MFLVYVLVLLKLGYLYLKLPLLFFRLTLGLVELFFRHLILSSLEYGLVKIFLPVSSGLMSLVLQSSDLKAVRLFLYSL